MGFLGSTRSPFLSSAISETEPTPSGRYDQAHCRYMVGRSARGRACARNVDEESAGELLLTCLLPEERRVNSPFLNASTITHPLLLSLCCLTLWAWALPAVLHPAEQAEERLQGSWTATKAERDGKAAGDVVGNRLIFTGNRFQIESKEGKTLYAGRVRVNPRAKPAAVDFEHTEGAVRGKAWKGIFSLEGDTLRICDNAANLAKHRPIAFETKSRSGMSSLRSNAPLLEVNLEILRMAG